MGDVAETWIGEAGLFLIEARFSVPHESMRRDGARRITVDLSRPVHSPVRGLFASFLSAVRRRKRNRMSRSRLRGLLAIACPLFHIATPILSALQSEWKHRRVSRARCLKSRKRCLRHRAWRVLSRVSWMAPRGLGRIIGFNCLGAVTESAFSGLDRGAWALQPTSHERPH